MTQEAIHNGRSEAEVLALLRETLKPYIGAWRSSKSYAEGLDGSGKAWSKRGLGFNAGLMGDGEGDGVKAQRGLDAVIFYAVSEATGLLFGEIVAGLSEVAVYGTPGKHPASGFLRSLDILAVRSLDNFTTRVRTTRIAAQVVTPDVEKYRNAHGQNAERIASDQHRIALDQVYNDCGSKTPNLGNFSAVLKRADERIAQILGEVERIPSGESSVRLQAKGRERFDQMGGTLIPEIGVVVTNDGAYVLTDATGKSGKTDQGPIVKLADGSLVDMDGNPYEKPAPKPNLPPKKIPQPKGPKVIGTTL